MFFYTIPILNEKYNVCIDKCPVFLKKDQFQLWKNHIPLHNVSLDSILSLRKLNCLFSLPYAFLSIINASIIQEKHWIQNWIVQLNQCKMVSSSMQNFLGHVLCALWPLFPVPKSIKLYITKVIWKYSIFFHSVAQVTPCSYKFLSPMSGFCRTSIPKGEDQHCVILLVILLHGQLQVIACHFQIC